MEGGTEQAEDEKERRMGNCGTREESALTAAHGILFPINAGRIGLYAFPFFFKSSFIFFRSLISVLCCCFCYDRHVGSMRLIKFVLTDKQVTDCSVSFSLMLFVFLPVFLLLSLGSPSSYFELHH